MTHLSDLIAELRKGDGNGCERSNWLMQEAADALMANQGAIVNSIIERTRHESTDDERESPNISVRYAFREGYESGFRDGEIGEWRGDVEPQGELSDAQTLVASHEELCGCVLDDCEFKTGWRAALRAAGTKGEPSDAQVQAALDASVAYYSTTWVGKIDPEPVDFDAMRAALRAAGEVTR